MALHPLIASELAAAAASDLTPYHRLPVPQARAQMKKAYTRQVTVEVARVQDFEVPGPAGEVGVRCYQPLGAESAPPLVVFFHGSGFCGLDLDTHDEICRRLTAGSSCVVASVDYRLAPEHPFPAGPDDCLAATRALADMASDLGADSQRLALAGDSAGACLALVTALRLRDEGGPQAGALVLWYPVTDHPSGAWPSYERHARGLGLSAEGMAWFWQNYLPDASLAGHPHVSPVRADLQGLPATWLMTAEYDVLADEGQALAQRLRAAGVSVQFDRASGLNHGFLKYAARIAEAEAGMARACAWLRRTWPLQASSAKGASTETYTG